MNEIGQAAPGWYPDATGHLRWWTGSTWGVYAEGAMPVPAPPYPGAMPGARSDATSLAMLAHLGMLVGGFIVPLIIYLTTGAQDPFVKHHAAEALNFSITYLFASLACMVMFFVGILVWPLLIVAFLCLFTIAIGHFVLLVMASIKAYRGEWWRYPVNIRLVPGAYGA